MASVDVRFFFEGRQLRGVRGEPIAKALLRAGVRTLSYSVKYRRSRSIHCARGRCVMCHMSVNGAPGVPTCITPLEEGMRIERENYQPFFGPLFTAAARFLPLPAGFYYRLFTKPRFLRTLFMRSLRKMAGVGRVPVDERLRVETHGDVREDRAPIDGLYDVIVVGAGIAGMSAAVASAQSGSNVLLVDEYGIPGGHSIGFQPDTELAARRDRLVVDVQRHPSIHFRSSTTALGFYPPDTLLLGPGGSTGFVPYAGRATRSVETDAGTPKRAMKRVRAGSFVFATGAYDVVPLFESNDTPGIFGSRAIRLLLERDGLRPGRRAVLYGNGPTLGETAELLLHHGINVTALVDRSDRPSERVSSSEEPDGIPRISGARVTGVKGKDWISAVTVAEDKTRDGKPSTMTSLPCDILCTAFAGQGAYELPYQAGFEFLFREAALAENRTLVAEQTRIGPPPGMGAACYVVGEAAGETVWIRKIESGTEAGRHAARSLNS